MTNFRSQFREKPGNLENVQSRDTFCFLIFRNIMFNIYELYHGNLIMGYVYILLKFYFHKTSNNVTSQTFHFRSAAIFFVSLALACCISSLCLGACSYLTGLVLQCIRDNFFSFLFTFFTRTPKLLLNHI